VRDRKPGFHYCLVYTGGDEVARYLDMGYRPCTWEYDESGNPVGPHVLSGRSADREPGREIVARDHLLMEIDAEGHQQIQNEGEGGGTGWNFSKVLEENLVDHDGQEDPMRGISRRYAHLTADRDHGFTETFVTE